MRHTIAHHATDVDLHMKHVFINQEMIKICLQVDDGVDKDALDSDSLEDKLNSLTDGTWDNIKPASRETLAQRIGIPTREKSKQYRKNMIAVLCCSSLIGISLAVLNFPFNVLISMPPAVPLLFNLHCILKHVE